MSRARFLAAVAALLILSGTAPAQSGRVRRTVTQPVPVERTTPAPAAPAEEPAPEAIEAAPEPLEAAPANGPADGPPSTENAPKIDQRYTVRYEAGSLGIDADSKIGLSVTNDAIQLKGKGIDVAVLTSSITKILYTSRSRNRTAEGVGVGAVNPVGGAILRSMKTTKHYIEIVWEGSTPGGVFLRVDKDDYRGLLASLQAAARREADYEIDPPVRDFE